MRAPPKRRTRAAAEEFGTGINGKLADYLSVYKNISGNELGALYAMTRKAPEGDLPGERGKFQYWDLDQYARLCGRSVPELLELGSGISPSYLGDPSCRYDGPLFERCKAVKRFYELLQTGEQAEKEKAAKIIHLIAQTRPWIEESLNATSPVWRIKLFYRNMIQVARWPSHFPTLERIGAMGGYDGLPSTPLIEQFVRFIPQIGNSSHDYAQLCQYYSLSFHWAFAQKPETSVYGFPEDGDELLFDQFTLLQTNEQQFLCRGLR